MHSNLSCLSFLIAQMDGPIRHSRYSKRAFDISLGHRNFGKATVDCGFLASKSQWGSLGGDPAGLLRMMLNFHEPADYKLASAEICLSFLVGDDGSPPSVTEHIYPDLLCGPPISQQRSRNIVLEPSVEAFGTSIGGLGVHNSVDWSKTHRWLLRGSRLPDEQNSYTRASWAWKANKLNEQNELIRAFQLAVVLAQSQPSIKIRIAIEGKLERNRWKYKFGGRDHEPQNATSLELPLRDDDLSPVIKELAEEIHRLNVAFVPGVNNTPAAGAASSETLHLAT